jgi:hypothetical protein
MGYRHRRPPVGEVNIDDENDASIELAQRDRREILEPGILAPETINQLDLIGDGHDPSSRRRTIWQWRYVTDVPDNSKNVTCDLCHETIVYDHASSHLTKHFNRHHEQLSERKEMERKRAEKEMRRLIAQEHVDREGDDRSATPKTPFEHLLRFLVTAYLPNRVVENEHFREFCRALNPTAEVYSRDRVTEALVSSAQDIRIRVSIQQVNRSCHGHVVCLNSWS